MTFEHIRSLAHHVFFHPFEEYGALATNIVPGLVVGVVALVVAMCVGGMRAPRNLDHRTDGPGRQNAGVGADPIGTSWAEIIDDLFDRDDRALGAEHRLLLNADDAFQEDIAFTVRLLRMDHRTIGA